MGREGFAAQDGVEKRQLHGLFGVVQLRVVSAIDGPGREADQEEQFSGDDHPPVVTQKGTKLGLVLGDQVDRAGGNQQHHKHDRDPRVTQEPEADQHPQAVACQQQPQRFGQRIAAIRQPSEQPESNGQGDQPQDLQNQVPGDEGGHCVILNVTSHEWGHE